MHSTGQLQCHYVGVQYPDQMVRSERAIFSRWLLCLGEYFVLGRVGTPDSYSHSDTNAVALHL